MPHFADAQKFQATNVPSVLIKEKVLATRGKYNIPSSWYLYTSDDQVDLIYHTLESNEGLAYVGISESTLTYGLRLPLLLIIKKQLTQMGITLGQLDPNSFF